MRERERDWSELVNISAKVWSWPLHHNATNGKQTQKEAEMMNENRLYAGSYDRTQFDTLPASFICLCCVFGLKVICCSVV